MQVKTVLDGPPGTGAREHQEIHCVVPSEEGLGGKFDVTVENGAGRATHEWEFTKTPTIMSIKPAKAPIGFTGTVQIYGKYMKFEPKQQWSVRLGVLLCLHPFETDFGVQCEVTGEKHPDNDGSGGTEILTWPPWHSTKAMTKAGGEC